MTSFCFTDWPVTANERKHMVDHEKLILQAKLKDKKPKHSHFGACGKDFLKKRQLMNGIKLWNLLSVVIDS
jgi:hypothetical protein